jgi:hypothetical protein
MASDQYSRGVMAGRARHDVVTDAFDVEGV